MISLYIHIPFCKQKCSYCTFYSHDNAIAPQYVNSVVNALEHFSGEEVYSVYIGGGTPSTLKPSELLKILNAVFKNYNVLKDAEITIEANPESVTDEFLAAAKSGGVNRISLGIQSFVNKELKAINRLHDNKTAIAAVKKCKDHGFFNISCDLIFGLPYQTQNSLEYSLNTLLSLDIPHISCYNLQLEEGAPILKFASKVPNEETQRDMYFCVCNTLKSAGFCHYEISNFAKSGFEAKHNSIYWQGNDYLGIGPSAHSLLKGVRYSFNADTYKFINNKDFVFDTSERIESPLFEKIMLGLRTANGINTSLLKNSDNYIKGLVKGGFATVKDGVLSLTDEGFYLSNTIISDIISKEC